MKVSDEAEQAAKDAVARCTNVLRDHDTPIQWQLLAAAILIFAAKEFSNGHTNGNGKKR